MRSGWSSSKPTVLLGMLYHVCILSLLFFFSSLLIKRFASRNWFSNITITIFASKNQLTRSSQKSPVQTAVLLESCQLYRVVITYTPVRIMVYAGTVCLVHVNKQLSQTLLNCLIKRPYGGEVLSCSFEFRVGGIIC